MTNVILDAKRFGHDIKKLNVGGGLGIKYTEMMTHPQLMNGLKQFLTQLLMLVKNKI